MAKPKKQPNPPRKCIFCKGTPISREHVFAAWMEPYLPDPKGDHPHNLRLTRIHAGKFEPGKVSSGQFNRPGPMRSKKLKVACEPCNNGWMSVLQKTAKPILLPFILGEWPHLASAEQQILAAWITMFVMVLEKSLEPVETITPEERRTFKEQEEKRGPPKNWFIWIFSNDDEYNPSNFHTRTTAPDQKGGQITPRVEEIAFDSRITVFSLNRLGVVVISTREDRVFSLVSTPLMKLAAGVGLKLLWPISPYGPPEKPTNTLPMGGAAPFRDKATELLVGASNWHRRNSQ
jgi:hypothetical protein